MVNIQDDCRLQRKLGQLLHENGLRIIYAFRITHFKLAGSLTLHKAQEKTF